MSFRCSSITPVARASSPPGEVRDMASAAEHEVAVNFVAHHYNAGLTAYRGELGKEGVAAPLNADWVVRVAE